MCSAKTNVQVLTDLMQFSRYGALAQVFIIDAIQKQARLAAATDPEKIDSALVSGQAWVGVAAEIRDALDKHYGEAVPVPAPSHKVMLFAALLAADEIVVNDHEADEVRLSPSSPDSQPYLTTANGDIILINDQQIDLVDESSGSRSRFVDVRGIFHELLLQTVVRGALQMATAA